MISSKLVKLLLVLFCVSTVNCWLWSSSSEEVKKEEVVVVPAEDSTLDTNPDSHVTEDIVPAEDSTLDTKRKTHEHNLSDKTHYSDVDNDGKFEHNSDYDHDAFLGKDEADKFKTLTPDESKQKLGKIIDKIDIGHDGSVTLDELTDWIKSVNQKAISLEVEERWKSFGQNSTVEEYLEKNYGQLKQWTEEEKKKNEKDYKTYQKILKRDEIRFNAADENKDGKLSKKEYTYFLHPEEYPAMREIVITETLEDLDSNEDGVVSVDEFVKDFYDANEPEPDWIQAERTNFEQFRDVNKDKVLDREELANWIMPPDFDRSLSEAQHLIYEADGNKDGKLTKEEIIENYNVFVASSATNYGSDIYEHEDL